VTTRAGGGDVGDAQLAMKTPIMIERFTCEADFPHGR
jgi:hypothetical protein